MFKFSGELVSATAGSGCVRKRVMVGGLGRFTDRDFEIEGDNWMFCKGLVGHGEEVR